MFSLVARDRLRVLRNSLLRWCSLLKKRASGRCTRLVFVLVQHPTPLNACFFLLVEHCSGRVTEIGSGQYTKGLERTTQVILVGKYTLTQTVTANLSSRHHTAKRAHRAHELSMSFTTTLTAGRCELSSAPADRCDLHAHRVNNSQPY